MAQFKVQTLNSNSIWDDKKRYKTNSVVLYNDVIYQNITGRNSNPEDLTDWIAIYKIAITGFIPLSGTIEGSPVTGDIEIDNFIGIISKSVSEDGISKVISEDGALRMSSSSILSGLGSVVSVYKEYISINNNTPGSRGLAGEQDFTPNITDLDYVQKKYVDEKLVTNATVTGSYAIDWTNDVWDLTLTGNTTLTESNLPATGKTKTITLNVSGNFTLTYPAGWTSKITGAYIGTATLNTITIQYYGVGKYKVLIVQPS